MKNYINTYIYIYIYIHIYIHICIYYIYTHYIYECKHVCISTYIYHITYIKKGEKIDMYNIYNIYTYTYIYIYIYIYTIVYNKCTIDACFFYKYMEFQLRLDMFKDCI